MSKVITATLTTVPNYHVDDKTGNRYTHLAGERVYIPVNKIVAVVPDPFTGGCIIHTEHKEFRVDEYTHMILGAMDQTIVNVNDYDEYVI